MGNSAALAENSTDRTGFSRTGPDFESGPVSDDPEVNKEALELALNGIETDDGQLERAEEQFRKDVEGWC